MAKGGRREGAGRKPGSLNRKSREVIEAAATAGITPVEYMLQVMRDEGNAPDMRLDAAKAAAPFIHPRLQAIEIGGEDDNPVRLVHTIERRIVRSGD